MSFWSDFFFGMGSVFDIAPPMSVARIQHHTLGSLEDDAKALNEDWNRILSDTPSADCSRAGNGSSLDANATDRGNKV